jgi:hypothetical protein
MPVVGFNAQQVRAGRPSGSATLAKNIVRVNLRDWEVGFNGAMRAVATAGVGGAKGPGLVDGPELATPQRDSGCGQVSGRLLPLMTAG